MSDSSTHHQSTARLAAQQYGHVTRKQLRAHGVPVSTIDAWVRDGRLVPVYRGVYAVGYRRVEPVARAYAAVLACGPAAVLSHDSALALWGLRRWPFELEVLVPGCVRRAGIVAHRSTTLTAGERTVELGVPVTRPARAIADMGRRLTGPQRIRLVNDARLRRILDPEEQARLLGHRENPTRSGLEDRFRAWLARHGLPLPEFNVMIRGVEVDALYAAQQLIVELDAYPTHGNPVAFQADRDRDLRHLELGFATLRLTEERLTDEMAARLRRMLDERAA